MGGALVDYTDTNKKGVCPYIANCVTEFKTEFHGLIFWQLSILRPIGPNKSGSQIIEISVFYSSSYRKGYVKFKDFSRTSKKPILQFSRTTSL